MVPSTAAARGAGSTITGSRQMEQSTIEPEGVLGGVLGVAEADPEAAELELKGRGRDEATGVRGGAPKAA